LYVQTSGGLLAAVPAGCVEKLLISLHSAGYTSAAAIGTVIKREEHDILVVLAE
jgi:hydrogenase maturation factor